MSAWPIIELYCPAVSPLCLPLCLSVVLCLRLTACLPVCVSMFFATTGPGLSVAFKKKAIAKRHVAVLKTYTDKDIMRHIANRQTTEYSEEKDRQINHTGP